MSLIDSKIVEARFDNAQFTQGVQSTLSQLDQLKSRLNLPGASRGLDDVNAAAGRFNGQPMVDGAGRIGVAFSTMQTVAMTAISNVTNRAINAATQLANSFTLEPLVAGFQEYELKMGSIQTILANTAKHGTTLETVNHELEVLNQYADQTIYNFGDMTRNIGLFTNAGIKVEDATTMIKGFSNAAAASGTNAEQAAHAAQQLSQGLSAGKITAQDWISLTNAGMGNKNMQEGLIGIAEAMGTFTGSGYTAIDAGKNFKNTLEGGWVTSDVMSTYLRIMSGDMDDAAIAAIGLDENMVSMLRSQATMGLEAATKVRTLTQLMGTLKESVGSGWAESFAILFGDFDEATDLFTGLSQSIGGWLGAMSKNRNDMLQEFKEMGGRTLLIDALQEAFWALARVLIPISRAFKDTFAAMDAERLYNLVEQFRDFVDALYPSTETMELLQRSFMGLFAILGIGWEIIKAVGGFLGDLFLGIEEGDKGILKFTATLGDFLVGLHNAIRDGQGFRKFLDKVRDGLFLIINPIKNFMSLLGNMFSGVDVSGAGTVLGEMITNLLTFGEAADKGSSALDRVKSVFGSFISFFSGLGSFVADLIRPFTDGLSEMFSDIDYDQVMEGLQTGLLAGLVVVIKQLGGMFSGLSLFQNAGGGIIDTIKEGLDNLTGTLSAMQANLKANVLIKIAGAIALLAISVVLLAGVDGPGLLRATSALTAMFIQLGVAMAVFQSIGTVAGIVRLNLMGSALILLAAAIVILTFAVRNLANLSWEQLAKGLTGLAVLLGLVVAASHGIDKSRGQILRSSAALILLAIAVGQLVDVVYALGGLEWDVLIKGLVGVGSLLVGLALFSKFAAANRGGLAQGAGILLLAQGIKTLAEAIKLFADMKPEDIAKGMASMAVGLTILGAALTKIPGGVRMVIAAVAVTKLAGAFLLIATGLKAFEQISWDTLAKGLIGVTVALGLMVFAMHKMPKIGIGQAVGFLIIASAIATLAQALRMLGGMDTGDLVKSLIGLAAGLGVIVIALNLMNGTLAGAAAIFVVAGALAVLAPILKVFSSMSIAEIATALGMLAGVFVVLGLAGLVLAPVIPALMGLGVAMILLGGAMLLAGAGLALFAIGLTALAAAGATGVASLVAIVSALIGLIPMIAEQIGLGIVALLTALGNSGVALTEAFVNIVTALLDGIIRLAPKIGATMLVLVMTGLNVLITAVPAFVNAGLRMLIGILTGIANNIGRIVDVATDIIVNFINALARNLPRIIQAGVNFIISFVNGLAEGIRNNSRAMGDAGANLATAMVDGMINGLLGAGGRVVSQARALATRAWEAAKDALGIASPSKKFMEVGRYSSEGMALGLKNYSYLSERAAASVGTNTVEAMGKSIAGLGDLVQMDDLNPRITPVLDLSDLRRNAPDIARILDGAPVNVSGAYSRAVEASAGLAANLNAALEDARGGDVYEFNQVNNSPRALSTAEIYRNTNNQFSRAKGALTNAN